MKKNSVGGHTLCELSIPLVVHRTAYFVTLTVDGKHIPGSPVVCSSCDAARPAGRSPSPEVTVLMPCYDGYAETLSCIGSVLASFRRNTRRVRLFVMWDHGPDTRLWEALRRLAARKKIVLESTPVNMGFLGCVNHALSRVSGGDVILLNADTLVHGDWVDRMAAIARREDAGTVTALGSDAELCSFPAPHDRGDVRTLSDVAVLDSACASLPPSWQVREIPVGVGFCLYLPRRALERLGGLDGLRVFRGYGEETDFCLRVAESGLKNYVACNVYVAHLGGRSFGAAKKALAAQNNRALFARYSDYDADYDKFLLENALGDVNDRISRRACRYAGGTLHARAWGEQFLKTERKIPGAHCFGLACGGGVRVILRLYQGIKLADMHFVLPEEYDEWRQLVQRCGFTHMSVHGEHVWAEQLAKACAIEVQPSKEPLAELTALEPATGDNVILATPLTMSQWQRCCDLARRKPEVTFWAPSLNKTWGGAPRPGNMVPLPEMESLRAFNPDSLIFTEIPELGSLELWRVWLEDHDLVKVPAGIVSTEVA